MGGWERKKDEKERKVKRKLKLETRVRELAERRPGTGQSWLSFES